MFEAIEVEQIRHFLVVNEICAGHRSFGCCVRKKSGFDCIPRPFRFACVRVPSVVKYLLRLLEEKGVMLHTHRVLKIGGVLADINNDDFVSDESDDVIMMLV